MTLSQQCKSPTL